MICPNGKGDGVTSAIAPETHEIQLPDFASDDEHGKALAILKAQAERCGCTLLELADGGFLICKWNYSRAAPCVRSAGNLLRQIGGRHG
jgi:hypothetical protein